jgi:multidrug efflux pump subunit AcrA (membrane-fusion protein)
MRRTLFLLPWLFLAAGCGTSLGGGPTPLPTVVLDVGGSPSTPGASFGEATASGVVASSHEASLAFDQGGLVQAVHVALGDSVGAGDVLVELDSTSAQLELDRAQRVLREMTSPAAIAAADQAVASAMEAQDKAQKKVVSLSYPRATEAFINNLAAQITLARKELAGASRDFNNYEDLPKNDPDRARAELRYTNAQINLNKLTGNYNWYTGQPSEIDVALTHANLDAAVAAVQEAQWYAAALRGEPIPAEASGTMLAALQSAKDAVVAAEAGLEATRIVSPFGGVVGRVDVRLGEFAQAGQAVLLVTDLEHLQVETTDLSELDLPKVAVGQPVLVDVEAIGAQVPGRVTAIAPTSQTLGGDVVYQVIVVLDEIPAGLRPGMSVTVAFGALP